MFEKQSQQISNTFVNNVVVMDQTISLPNLPVLSHPDYSICRLTLEEAELLQQLFEHCADFFIMTNGDLPSPTAALDEFADTPDGKGVDDLYFFGLTDKHKQLVRAITAVQHYPDNQTWWIGLMLLTPELRGKGLGAAFYRAFEQWLASQGVTYISLCAIATNTPAKQFWQRMGFEITHTVSNKPYGKKTHDLDVFRRTIANS